MKAMIAALLLTLSLSTLAGEIVLLDKATWLLGSYNSSMTSTFEVNRELGRAWVSLYFSSTSDDGAGHEERVKVDGMSYRAETKEVVLVAEGAEIVCAKVIENFFGTQVKPTRNCKIVEKNYFARVDDGFEIRKEARTRVMLVY